MNAPQVEKRQHAIERVIGADAQLLGNVFFSGGMRIDGEVRGNVSALEGQPATLIVGEHGHVAGNIQVARLIVYGTIAGRIRVSSVVELHAKAQVGCDLEYHEMIMHPGALIQGRLVCREEAGRGGKSADHLRLRPDLSS